jgi:hypothetical protein
MAGDEDNRQADLGGGELALQVKPAQPRQPYVEHQTAGRVRGLTRQEFPGGPEGLDAESHRPDQAGEGIPHRRIIIDHEDDGA